MNEPLKIKFKKMRPNAICPKQAKPGDVGLDLYSAEYVIINPFEYKVVSTGIGIRLPKGWYARVEEKSGLAAKKGVRIGAGIIDNDFLGEIGVVVHNLNVLPYLNSLFNPNPLTSHIGTEGRLEIKPGDKIAQLIISSWVETEWVEVSELGETERGSDGFGSTGMA